MSRLPTPGGDQGDWGTILNDYLSQAHDVNGVLKAGVVGSAQLQDGSIAETKLSSSAQSKLNTVAPVTSVASKTGDVILAKADVGLANIDNTSDANKPISIAMQAALDTKQPIGTYATTAYVDTAVTNAATDTAAFARYVIVSTGSEARPGATGGLVIWVDMRADTSIQPAAMQPQDLRLIPDQPPFAPIIVTQALSLMTQNSTFSQTLAANGTAPIIWTVTAGSLPGGILLSGGGALSGTPSGSGAYDFTVTATNSVGSSTQRYTGTVALAGVIEHTVFGAGTLSGGNPITFNDAGPNSWLAQQFYLTDSPSRNWKIAGMRLYVPTGSSLIGQGGSIALQRRAAEDGGLFPSGVGLTFDTTNGSLTPFSAPLTAGWNDYYFNQEFLANSLDSLVIGYTLGGGYVYSAHSDNAGAIQSSDGSNLYLAEQFGLAGRCYYSDSITGSGTLNNVQSAWWYGIDIILRES